MTKEDLDATEAPLIDHLMELRTRLIYCVIGLAISFAASFYFSTPILQYLLLPFKWGTSKDVTLISTHLLGVFIVKLKIAFFGALFVTFPLVAIKFFYALAAATGGEGQPAVELMPDVLAYLDFVMTLILAFGLCFQLPVVLTLLGQIGIVNYEQLKSGRKFAVVGVFVIAAVLTPPDPISQICMAIPLMALYELSVQAVRFIERRRAAAEAARD